MKWCSKNSYRKNIYFCISIQKAWVLIWNLSPTQISQTTGFCSLSSTCNFWNTMWKNTLNVTSLPGLGTPKQVCYCLSCHLWGGKKAILRGKDLLPVIHSGSGFLLESLDNNELCSQLRYRVFDLFLNKEIWLFPTQ